jgi:hypothetical protein
MTEGGGEGGAVDVHFPNEASDWPTREHLVYLYLAIQDGPVSQRRLAELTGLSQPTVHRALHGYRPEAPGLIDRGRAEQTHDADKPGRSLYRVIQSE